MKKLIISLFLLMLLAGPVSADRAQYVPDITVDSLTADRVVITDTSKKLISAGTTAAELENLTNGTNADALHSHSIGFSISDIDISSDTNLAVTAPITLTDDTVGITVSKDLVVSGTGLSGGADDVLPGSDGDVTITMTTAKDLVVSGTGLSGGENDVFPGADADVNVTLTTAKDLVVSGTGLSGGENDVFPGADSDVTVTLTVTKDLVAGNGLTGGENNVFPGADTDVTLTLGTPSTLTSATTNAVTTTSHTHAIDSTIARSAITLTAGAGLTGGGDLSASRTFTVGAGNGITVNADDVALTTPGTLTSATTNVASGSHTHAITNYAVSGTANQVTVTGAGKVLGAATTLSLPNPINVSTSANAATVTVTADSAFATTNYLLFSDAASGSESPLTNTGLLYNSSTNAVTVAAATIGVDADEDPSITFDGDTSNGILNYDEDNAEFEFDQDVVVSGDVTIIADDNTIHFDSLTASESDWWIGVNNDSVGDDNDPFEIRRSATPGTSADISIAIDGTTTFSAFPVTPSDEPDADYEVANKKYVNDRTFINVLDYGADNTGSVYTHVAIQDAIDSNKGKTIFFPAGTYKISTSITMAGTSYNGTRLIGDGMSTTIISAIGCDGIVCSTGIRYIGISDIYVEGDVTASTNGIELNQAISGCKVENVLVKNFGTDGNGAGIFVGNTSSAGTWCVYLDNVSVEYCGRGIVIDTAQAISIRDATVRLNQGTALTATDCYVLTISGGTYENARHRSGPPPTYTVPSSWAMNFDDCDSVSISGVSTEGNTEGVLRLNDCYGASVTGSQLFGGSDTDAICVSLEGTTRSCNFSGCMLNGLWLSTQKYISCEATTYDNTFTSLYIQKFVDADITSANVIVDSGTRNVFTNITGPSGTTWVVPSATTFTPTIAFATNGDFSPTNTALYGRVVYDYLSRNGKIAYVEISVEFDTNAYTTASGNFIIGNLPFTVKNSSGSTFVPLGVFSTKVAMGSYAHYLAAARKNTDYINLVGLASGASYIVLGTSQIPASTADVIISISGMVEIE